MSVDARLRTEATKCLEAAAGDRWAATDGLIAWLAEAEPMTSALLGHAARLRSAARTMIDRVAPHRASE